MQNNSSKTNRILLVVVILLLLTVIWMLWHMRKAEEGKDNSINTQTQLSHDSRKDWIIYTDNRLGFSFYHAPDHLLQDPNLPTYSADASRHGNDYKCPLPNNSMRLYSEEEVEKDKVDVTRCTYIPPNIDEVAEGKFTARWSESVYGTGKNIENIVVDGRPARLVYGSNSVRTLIILLEKPYVENGYRYDFLDILADQVLMKDIIETIKLKK